MDRMECFDHIGSKVGGLPYIIATATSVHSIGVYINETEPRSFTSDPRPSVIDTHASLSASIPCGMRTSSNDSVCSHLDGRWKHKKDRMGLDLCSRTRGHGYQTTSIITSSAVPSLPIGLRPNLSCVDLTGTAVVTVERL